MRYFVILVALSLAGCVYADLGDYDQGDDCRCMPVSIYKTGDPCPLRFDAIEVCSADEVGEFPCETWGESGDQFFGHSEVAMEVTFCSTFTRGNGYYVQDWNGEGAYCQYNPEKNGYYVVEWAQACQPHSSHTAGRPRRAMRRKN